MRITFKIKYSYYENEQNTKKKKKKRNGLKKIMINK